MQGDAVGLLIAQSGSLTCGLTRPCPLLIRGRRFAVDGAARYDLRRFIGRVNPDLLGELLQRRRPVDEALRVRVVGGEPDLVAAQQRFLSFAIMHLLGGQHGDAAVPMVVVVPVEQRLEDLPPVLDAAEARRQLRARLESPEVRLGVGVVVGKGKG